MTNSTLNTTVTTFHNITINSYPPFYQSLIIFVLGLIPLAVIFWIMFKTDFFQELMETMYDDIARPKYTNEYQCRCNRCRFELRTKKGMKRWKKTHKYKKDELI